MSKYISKTVIQLSFLKVESGEEHIVTVPEDSTAEDLARIIRNTLHLNPGTVLTEVYIDHEFKKED